MRGSGCEEIGNDPRNRPTTSQHDCVSESSSRNLMNYHSHTHTHTHTVLTAIFPGEPGLAGCTLNSPSPFIPGLRILSMRRHSNSVEKRTKVKEIIEHNKNSNQKRTHNTTYYMETVSHTHSYKIVKKCCQKHYAAA